MIKIGRNGVVWHVLMWIFAATNLAVTSVGAQAQDGQRDAANRPFTVASWGGDYARAQMRALFQPFATTKELAFDIVDFPGDPAAIDFQIQTDRIFWDVVDLEYPDANALCQRGALEPIDAVLAQIDSADFIDGALSDCGIGNVVWSMGIAFDPSWFEAQPPTSFAHFFDPAYRGPRALTTSPVGLMEFASLAGGIDPAAIYDSLASSEGTLLALDTLDGIKQQIDWHAHDVAAFRGLENAQASMALVPHILPARRAVKGGFRAGFLWDRHFYQMDAFVIVRGAVNQENAVSFLVDSGLPAYQGTMATLSLYGPTNQRALEFVSQSVLPWMPHAPGNRDGALALDAAWWQTPAGKAAWQAFDDWRNQ